MGVHQMRRLRVLLVEDHSETAVSFAKRLKMDGFIVHIAPGFNAALKLASDYRFDVLLSDIALPDGNGADLMRTLLSEHEAIKGIAIAGNGAQEDVEICTNAGFSSHLLKPVSFEKVTEVLGQICADIHSLRENDGHIGPNLEYIRNMPVQE